MPLSVPDVGSPPPPGCAPGAHGARQPLRPSPARVHLLEHIQHPACLGWTIRDRWQFWMHGRCASGGRTGRENIVDHMHREDRSCFLVESRTKTPVVSRSVMELSSMSGARAHGNAGSWTSVERKKGHVIVQNARSPRGCFSGKSSRVPRLDAAGCCFT